MQAIINAAASAYKGLIPDNCWHEPYMSLEELQAEIQAGVRFWGYEENSRLVAVMGIQDKREVTLIRHAYVKTDRQNLGIGSRLLKHLEGKTDKSILIGTWAGIPWTVRFYTKNGYRLLPKEEGKSLLRRFWSIPERQIEASIVLARFR
mgnify:CR=1 FL=1